RAIAAQLDEDVLDLAHAPVWGLVRSVQTEHPGHAILLVDSDGSDASRRALGHALGHALDPAEPQLAPRARPASGRARPPARPARRPALCAQAGPPSPRRRAGRARRTRVAARHS